MQSNHRRTLGLGLSALIMLGLASIATPAYAASNVAVDLPNAPVTGGSVVGVPITISGFAFTTVTVSLRAEAGTLTMVDPAPRKSTSNLGFNSLVDQTELSFRGPTADIAALLQNAVSWKAPAGSASSLKIRVQVSEYTVGISYDPASGKSYQFVAAPTLAWSAAQLDARTRTFLGKPGYLVNITSAAENTFVADRSGAENVWIGATANLALVNAARAAATPPQLPLLVNPQLTGDYYWADGPERAVQISTGLGPALSAVAGAYNGWAALEPNNFSNGVPGEACAVTNWQGTSGAWNDLNCDRDEAYLVEFDTTFTDFANTLVTFDNITGSGVDAVPAQLVATGTSSVAVFGGIAVALALLVGGGLLVAIRRRTAERTT